MSDPIEIELKLEFAEEHRDRLMSAAPLAEVEARTDHLVSAYFDTPDLDVRAAGYSLRVRHSGDRRIQTLKASGEGAAGLFVRAEWENDIEGDRPLVDANSGPLAKVVDREALARIRCVFETDVQRTRYKLQSGGAEIELAIDKGRIRAGKRREGLCEVELELDRGTPQALFDMVRRLDETVPLRLGVCSKSERGYALAAGERPAAFKAEPVRLDPDGNIRDAFVLIAQGCIRQFRCNETLLMESGAAPALHQARVGLRRLRSAFSLFKPLLAGDARVKRLRAELGWLAGELGEVRNVDVLIKRADGNLKDQLVAARARIFDHARGQLASARSRRLMIDLAEWLALGDWRLRPADRALADRSPASFATESLDRHRKRLKRRGRGLAALSDEHRHEARIEAKKLRYATEFFAALFPKHIARRRHAAFLDALEAMQDQLGELNDRVTGPQVLASLGIDPSAMMSRPDDGSELLARAEDAYERLMDVKRFWH